MWKKKKLAQDWSSLRFSSRKCDVYIFGRTFRWRHNFARNLAPPVQVKFQYQCQLWGRDTGLPAGRGNCWHDRGEVSGGCSQYKTGRFCGIRHHSGHVDTHTAILLLSTLFQRSQTPHCRVQPDRNSRQLYSYTVIYFRYGSLSFMPTSFVQIWPLLKWFSAFVLSIFMVYLHLHCKSVLNIDHLCRKCYHQLWSRQYHCQRTSDDREEETTSK